MQCNLTAANRHPLPHGKSAFPIRKKRQPRNGAIKYIIISISQTCGININIITNGWEQQQQQQKQICQRNNYNILE